MLKRTAQTGRILVSCYQDYLVGNYVPDYIVAFSTYTRITVLRRNDGHKTVPLVRGYVWHEKYIATFKNENSEIVSEIFLYIFYCIEKTIVTYNVVVENDNEM